MKNSCLLICTLFLAVTGYAQSPLETALKEIERNNPDLKAAVAGLDEDRLANRSETLLANPEIEFNYLWGADNLGGRRDVRISQSFDLATVSGLKTEKGACLDELAALKVEVRRLEVLQEARNLCIELIYYNTLMEELDDHLARSTSLVEAYEKRMAAGGATILDLNKAKLHLAAVQGQVNRSGNERQSVLARLRTLNGGNDFLFDATGYDLADNLPADFETWFAEAADKNPMLAYVRKEVALGQKQLALDRMAAVPELSVGYMSEIRTEEKFRGITVGVSVPLWSGSNRIKRSRAGVAAATSRQHAAEQAFYLRLKDLYRQASALKMNAVQMRSSLADTDYRDYLLSALTRGEISMIDFLVENDLYYDALQQTLEAERDYYHALAALKVF